MSNTDYNEVAETIDQMLEVVRAVVAALKEDGFTDREARSMTAALISANKTED